MNSHAQLCNARGVTLLILKEPAVIPSKWGQKKISRAEGRKLLLLCWKMPSRMDWIILGINEDS